MRDLEENVCEVCVGGDGGRAQRGLRDGETLQRVGIRGREGNSCSASPVAAARPGVVIGFLLIDASNAFNEENRTTMLQEV